MPCITVAAALATGRPFLKFHGVTTEHVLITTQNVTFLADPDATLRSDMPGNVLEIGGSSSSNLAIYDLTITSNESVAGTGISVDTGSAANVSLHRVRIVDNAAYGIIAGTRGILEMSQSIVSGNQQGGIIAVQGIGKVLIENNFVIRNGIPIPPLSTVYGGMVIPARADGYVRYNTIAFNGNSGVMYRGGMSCLSNGIIASNNLLFHNSEDNGAGGTKTDSTTQANFGVTGACQYQNTLAIPDDLKNLGFKSPLTLPYDFHLTSTSPPSIVDAAGDCSGLDIVDIDGDRRPMGYACDIGADEYNPSSRQ